jgi:lauroyl/myristoyl acyltransferase
VRIRPVLQVFAHLIGASFRVLPKQKRFAVARRIALTMAPLLKRTPYYERRPSPLDGPREEAMRMMLRTMTRARVEFVPEVELRGIELLPAGPFILAGAHFLLNIAMTRWFHDHGRTYIGSVGGPREPVYYFGTLVPLTFRYSGPQILVQIRRDLAAGHTSFIAIEAAIRYGDDWVAVDTVVGRRYVSPAAFTFAKRTGTPMIFVATYLNHEGRVVVTFERPQSDDPAVMTTEYCQFLKRHIGAVER